MLSLRTTANIDSPDSVGKRCQTAASLIPCDKKIPPHCECVSFSVGKRLPIYSAADIHCGSPAWTAAIILLFILLLILFIILFIILLIPVC